MLKKKDNIALIASSNGRNKEDKIKIKKLEKVLKDMDLNPIFSTFIYKDKFGKSVDAKIRAAEFMKFYKDDNIKAVFDISGGDIANEILDKLDYDIIKKKDKPFFGYSDVTTILNAISTKTGNKVYLYQIMNILDSEKRKNDFEATILRNEAKLKEVTWDFFQGKIIEGEIVGGNIRCLLKLAGTEYFPRVENKVLFLEGMSTTIESLTTHFAQLKQMGVFNKISGLLFGTFTKIEKDYTAEKIYNIVKEFIPENLPVAKTLQIGHSKDSKMLVINEKIKLSK